MARAGERRVFNRENSLTVRGRNLDDCARIGIGREVARNESWGNPELRARVIAEKAERRHYTVLGNQNLICLCPSASPIASSAPHRLSQRPCGLTFLSLWTLVYLFDLWISCLVAVHRQHGDAYELPPPMPLISPGCCC